MSWQPPRRIQLYILHTSRLGFTVALAVPLALLALAPLAGHATAHPLAPTSPRASASGQVGQSTQPNMYLSLHYDLSFGNAQAGLTQPTFMSTDAQGNLYVSDIQINKVYMYDTGGFNAQTYGTGGTSSTGGGIAAP